MPMPGGDQDMCFGSPLEFHVECFGVNVGELDAGVDGEGVAGHVEGDLKVGLLKFTESTCFLVTLMTSYGLTVF